VEGQQHGRGQLTYSNGDQYIGSWSEGLNHGRGTFKYVSGDTFTGD